MPLNDSDMPATFLVADRTALDGQRKTKALVRCELISLILAASSSVGTWRVGEAGLDIFSGVGSAAFVVALIALGYRTLRKPESVWYEGRAAAESIKTLAWRYAVKGDPFGERLDAAQATNMLVDRIRGTLNGLQQLVLPPPPADSVEVSPGMQRVRELPQRQRRDHYLTGRIQQQIAWYTANAQAHTRRNAFWTGVMALSAMTGLVLGVAKFVGAFDIDLMGVGAAAASSAMAWNQLTQNKTNSASYSVAAHELRLIRDQMMADAPEDWGSFVSDAEDAISREHIMWLARQGRSRGLAR